MNLKTIFSSTKNQILLILLIATITWSTSLHTEFSGYDGIDLFARNEYFNDSLFDTFKFFWNNIAASYNLAWTNIPSTIHRPLQWIASAIAYKFWGSTPLVNHLVFNFGIHLANTFLVFYILKALFNKVLKPNSLLPFCIALVWSVHPLHHEALNILTSGTGFLLGHFFALMGLFLLINIQTERKILFAFLASICFFIGYLGAEMALIIPFLLLLFPLFYSGFDLVKENAAKIFFAFVSLFVYLAYRFSISTERQEWLVRDPNEFFERVFVLAPQIFFHYLKLFMWPVKLTMDEHHNVILKNAFTPYHLLTLVIFISPIILVVFLLNRKQNNDKLVALVILFTYISIGMSLNIIPLYVLARDRYTYFFVLGLVVLIFLLLDRYFPNDFDLNLMLAKPRQKLLCVAFLVLVLGLGARSFTKNLDWKNGEVFWIKTINSVNDLGTKQNWRYKLLEYYKDPATSTFKPNPFIQQSTFKEFNEFPFTYNLLDDRVIELHRLEAQNANNYMLDKYGFAFNKSIATALYYNALISLQNRDVDSAAIFLKAAHKYYPEHFQANLRLLVYSWQFEKDQAQYYLDKLVPVSEKNAILARWLIKTLIFIKHPQAQMYAQHLASVFPNTTFLHGGI